MKTWEVVKALSENPKAKFTRASDGRKFETNATKISDGETVDYYVSGIANGGSECIALNDEWELVRQPVDFMTAVNSGKSIKSVDACYFEGLEMWTRDGRLTPERINGKWLIG